MKKTLIIGATTNPERYAYKAANMLVAKGYQLVNVGVKKGVVAGVEIQKPGAIYTDIDTVTLYVNSTIQPDYYDYILALKPKRVIFNPGTENEELQEQLAEHGIAYTEACTLVLLTTGQY